MPVGMGIAWNDRCVTEQFSCYIFSINRSKDSCPTIGRKHKCLTWWVCTTACHLMTEQGLYFTTFSFEIWSVDNWQTFKRNFKVEKITLRSGRGVCVCVCVCVCACICWCSTMHDLQLTLTTHIVLSRFYNWKYKIATVLFQTNSKLWRLLSC